jgi:hypothetical protein
MYVATTHRPVVIADQTLDTACSRADCPPLARRWALESPIWWTHGEDTPGAVKIRNNLLARAAERLDLRPLALGNPFLVIADSTDLPGFDADTVSWVRYRAMHRSAAGILRFSPVGLDDSRQNAVVFAQWRCGPDCGHTISVYLTRSESAWSIAQVLLTSRLKRQQLETAAAEVSPAGLLCASASSAPREACFAFKRSD